jgi:hypothetical protein
MRQKRIDAVKMEKKPLASENTELTTEKGLPQKPDEQIDLA